MRREDYLKALALVLLSVVSLVALLVSCFGEWSASDTSRVVVASMASILLVIGSLPRGPGAATATVTAAAVALASEAAGVLAAGVP